MKTIAISSFFVLFALAAGIVATTPAAFADHTEVTISPAAGSSSPGCDETAEGCFIPSTATVDEGGHVIMSNTDTAAHTFTSGTAADGPDGAFDTGLLMTGNSFEWVPDTAGEYPYFCMVHPWMKGLIIVEEAGHEHTDEEAAMNEGVPEGAPSATGMLSDGTAVNIWTSKPTKGEQMEITIEFVGAQHVNHDMLVTQNGNEVLNDKGAHHHEGIGMHKTAPLGSSDPVNITITFQGYGIDDPKTGPIGEKVVFSKVVPEFGTIAMMILAVAIISIIAVTAKSRVIPKL